MKGKKVRLLTTALLGGLLASGCSAQHPHNHKPVVVVTSSGEVIVPHPPPAPQPEAMGLPPEASAAWQAGSWTYVEDHWVWIPGRWQTPPRAGTTWVPGNWENTPRGWVWTPGRWE
jgi:hypothetical protein